VIKNKNHQKGALKSFEEPEIYRNCLSSVNDAGFIGMPIRRRLRELITRQVWRDHCNTYLHILDCNLVCLPGNIPRLYLP